VLARARASTYFTEDDKPALIDFVKQHKGIAGIVTSDNFGLSLMASIALTHQSSEAK